MKGRRAALLATTVTMALLTTGVAAAAEPTDDMESAGGTAVVQTAPERATATVPDADADAEGRAGLQAAMNAGATQALDLINQLRRSNGLAPLRVDGLLTTQAQGWATHLMTTGTLTGNPDLTFPGYPVEDSDYVEYGVKGTGTTTIPAYVDYAATHSSSSILMPNVNHVGIGWSTNGGSTAVLYWIAVEYDFTDIGPSDTFYDAVDFLSYAGITTGYPDGGFHPTGTVSREAMAAFLYRYMNHTTTIPACTGTERMFTDVPVGHPFCGAIEWLGGSGITTGYADGTFRPGANVTREAMAAFLYRGFVDPTIPTCTAGPRTFTDVGTAHPFCGAVEWLYTSNLTTGWPDHTFRPAASIERQAMAAFLFRFIDAGLVPTAD